MSTSLELFEHQTVRVGEELQATNGKIVKISPSIFEAIARFNEVEGGQYFRLGHQRFTVTHYVGYLETGGLTIEILPKADHGPAWTNQRPWKKGLLEMLRVAVGLRLKFLDEAAQHTSRASLLEIVASQFVDELEQLLHEGLARGYRDHEANGSTFRGRLMFSEHVRENLARADRFYVRHVTFDCDVAINRLLLESLLALQRVSVSVSLAARIGTCLGGFPAMQRERFSAASFDRLHLTRNTVRYKPALVLARMILEHHAPQLRSGASGVFAMLFDMNALWERYVAALFRRAAGEQFTVSTQERRGFWKVAGFPGRQVRPDIVVRRRSDDAVVLIADTKWKVFSEGAPDNDDLKQMFVYNELFQAPRSLLIYPSVAQELPRHGSYTDRSHRCSTLHLGLFDATGSGWIESGMREQIKGILTA